MTNNDISTTNLWQGKTVLITGVCGTIGSELLRQLTHNEVKHLIGIDNNETGLFFLSQDYCDHKFIEFFLCDIRDGDRLRKLMCNVDIVLHAAALKHVVLCERSPRDSVATNIQGMMNIIDAAEQNSVERLIFTSSDKAVNPTNVMGTTKLMGERLITAANAHRNDENDTIYASTRFGNVLGSRGSVIPIFKQQISQGGPVTLTDNEMTRFIMTLKDAVKLVLDSTFLACGGEVFVTKMPVIRIVDLASLMIEKFAPKYGYKPKDIEIKVIGSKPGEKLYEELLNNEELRRTIELSNFFAVLPAFKAVYHDIHYEYRDKNHSTIDNPYNSAIEKSLTREELKKYLEKYNLFGDM